MKCKCGNELTELIVRRLKNPIEMTETVYVHEFCCRCGRRLREVPENEYFINITTGTARLIKEEPIENVEGFLKYRIQEIVEAKTMTRGDYNYFRGWSLPNDEDGDDEGFLVKHENGRYSWTPKEEFESLTYGVQY